MSCRDATESSHLLLVMMEMYLVQVTERKHDLAGQVGHEVDCSGEIDGTNVAEWGT